jgi:HAD superfamily hydrolase (TIGR01549 family)
VSKTIFFDLDGTLYSYNSGHQAGLKGAYEYWSELTGDSYEKFFDKYMLNRSRIKRFLSGTVGSHSRVLYFQGMVEQDFQSSRPFHIAELTQRYWDAFINDIKPFENVESVLGNLKSKGYQLALITNMSAEVQFRKLHRLNLDNYFEAVITSEEAGQEKPHPHIYFHAIDRLNVNPKNCIMIGDDFKNDVEVAEFVGMRPILITIEQDEPSHSGFKLDAFAKLPKIIDKIYAQPLEGVIKYKLDHRKTEMNITQDLMQPLIELRDRLFELNLIGVYPSDHYLTPDVGFGNASIRYTNNGQFLVSGSQTGHIQKTNIEDYAIVLDYVIDDNKLVSKGMTKPSSESMTHAAIYEIAPEVNCVIHVHHKNMWENYEKLGMTTTPQDVPYGTPEMARAVQNVYRENPKLNSPVCMLGHIEGLLTWGETLDEAINLYLEALKKL